jgi:hypothetical protein
LTILFILFSFVFFSFLFDGVESDERGF